MLMPVPIMASSGLSGTLCRDGAKRRTARIKAIITAITNGTERIPARISPSGGRPPKNTSAGRSPRFSSKARIKPTSTTVSTIDRRKTNVDDSEPFGSSGLIPIAISSWPTTICVG